MGWRGGAVLPETAGAVGQAGAAWLRGEAGPRHLFSGPSALTPLQRAVLPECSVTWGL